MWQRTAGRYDQSALLSQFFASRALGFCFSYSWLITGRRKETAQNESQWKQIAAACVGILVLVGYGAFIVYLLMQIGMGNEQWTRAVYLLKGAEVVAFAGAGFLFGTQVGRIQEQMRIAKERGETT